MKRREFITLLGGAAAAWPLASRAQQGDRVKRLGVLWGLAENDNVYEPYLSAFKQRLQDLGWIDGRNVRVEYRFTGGVTERIRIAARELVAATPDVIFATTNPAVAALFQETQTIPIVFTLVSDSVGSGFVPSLAHPGGNITGFHNFEPELSGKWLRFSRRSRPK
jgi:putative ABC transport system substrate-binding protein